MRILIVDDDVARMVKLKTHLVSANGVPSDNISLAEYTNDALEFMRNTYFDVLIVDVILPKRVNSQKSSQNSLELLRKITKSVIYKKPRSIVGITANLEDIANYRDEFSKLCATVIKAKNGDSSWQKSISDFVDYNVVSGVSGELDKNNLQVITVHGIQTFGRWQNQLKRIVSENVGPIEFHNYKYGIFTLIAFFLPFLRMIECYRLRKKLIEKFKKNPDVEFVIFSHSFGTYLIFHAIRDIIKKKIFSEIPVRRIVLSGSVLKNRTDWSDFKNAGVSIYNDCADNDYVLYLSQLLIVGTGMGGKTGFYGFESTVVNRFFLGGHSSYFNGDGFIKKYWIPLMNLGDINNGAIDYRKESFIRHYLIDKVVYLSGPIISFCLMIGILLLIINFFINYFKIFIQHIGWINF